MRICIAGSMQFTEKMFEMREALIAIGHDAFFDHELAKNFLGKNDAQKEAVTIKQKLQDDAMKRFWKLVETADALLVLNFDKKGIANYIGGNTLLDMGIAYEHGKSIYLYNPTPELAYKSEIEAMRPVVINGDLSRIV